MNTSFILSRDDIELLPDALERFQTVKHMRHVLVDSSYLQHSSHGPVKEGP